MLASIVGPEERTPGRKSWIRRRKGGNAALSAASAGCAARSVRGSSATVCSRLFCSTAKAAAVRLKSVMKPLSAAGLASRSPATAPDCLRYWERSCCLIPRVASLTIALPSNAPFQYWIDLL